MINAIVLNHHSLPFTDIEHAKNGLLTFLTILKECQTYGLKILLVDENQDKSLMRLQLTPNYYINDWFTQAKNDANMRDWCRFLRRLETKQPLFEPIEWKEISHNIEVGLYGEKSANKVLLAAYHFETYLISFLAFEQWRTPYIPIWVINLTSDVEEKTDTVLNLVDKPSLAKHKERLVGQRNQLIDSAKAIWNQRTLISSPYISRQ